MPKLTVDIEWDQPDDPNWLNPYSLELVLAEYCPNTAFIVTEVGPELKQSGILKGFKFDMETCPQCGLARLTNCKQLDGTTP